MNNYPLLIEIKGTSRVKNIWFIHSQRSKGNLLYKLQPTLKKPFFITLADKILQLCTIRESTIFIIIYKMAVKYIPTNLRYQNFMTFN